MDTVESVATAKQTLYKMTHPSKTMWLVAHNSKDCAHVVELPMDCECLTGLGILEKCADQQAAETRAADFGWKPEEPIEIERGISTDTADGAEHPLPLVLDTKPTAAQLLDLSGAALMASAFGGL